MQNENVRPMKIMPASIRSLLAAILLLAAHASADGPLEPGISHYFDSFDPAQRPWNPGQPLNYEEVFKNYQYFEIVVAPSGRELTVNRYIRNVKESSARYALKADGSLSRDEANPGASP